MMNRSRLWVTAAAGCLCFVGLSGAAQPDARSFDVPAGELRVALDAYARQAGVQLLYRVEDVQNLKTSGVHGALDADVALTEILRGTSLKVHRDASGAVAISRVNKTSSTQPTPSGATAGSATTSSTELTAQSDTQDIAAAQSPVAPTRVNQEAARLEEVIVTAQKRNERLQDVPVPVTAIDAQTLTERNELRLKDYYMSVPGLSLNSNNLADSNLSIRGITTGGLTNPTVGITVDDVPYGSTTALGSRTAAPDLDPSDLARIEVLRGPQGTLYGASSLGGLMKFVTVDPSTDGVSGRVEGDLSSVNSGNAVGFGLRGAINVPLGDSFAIRASGYTRRDPGYIDDPALHAEGVNKVDVNGGRLSALWRLSADWSLKLSALFQDANASGAPYVALQPQLGDLQQSQLAGTGSYSHQVRSYAATWAGHFASFDLIAISGYSTDKYRGVNDLTGFYGPLAQAVFNVGGVSQFQNAETKKFTQEIRLSGSIEKKVDWLAGVFYTHEDTPTRDLYYGVDPASLSVAGLLFDDPYPTTYAEFAAFGDVTVHVTNLFDVQFGGRASENRQRYEESYTGPIDTFFGVMSPAFNPPEHTKDTSFTYLLTPRFRISSDLIAYGRLASGYRPGGPNPTCILFPVPCQYSPDRTRNYELGVKGNTPGRRLSFDASVYYIDWKDIQLQVAQPSTGFTYFTNSSGAKSEGIELSLQATPQPGLTLSGWVALSDAALTTGLPATSPVVGESDDRLPFSSHVSGNVALEKEWTLANGVRSYVGGSVTYVGDRKDVFEPSGLSRFDLPAYVKTDLRGGVRYEAWLINVYANNLTDKRGTISTGQIGFSTWVANYIQPRTAGLTVSKTF